MSDSSDACDVLILIPKRDELRAAAPVFGLDPDQPDVKLDDKYECWSTTIADLRVRIVLADSQGNARIALVESSALAALDPAVAFCVGTAAGREGEIDYLGVVLATTVLDATEWRMKDGDIQPQWTQMPAPSQDVVSDIDAFVKATDWRSGAREQLHAAIAAMDIQLDDELKADWPEVKDAWVVTTAFLHEDAPFLAKVWGLHTRLRAVDMETAGFVDACVSPARQRPWFVVRAVSDYGTKESKRDATRPAAGAAAAVIARALIENGLHRAHPLRIDPVEPADSVLSEQNFFSQLTMSDFLSEQIPARFGIPFEPGKVSPNLTVRDLAALCGDDDQVVGELDELREGYFTAKYLDYDDEADVRGLTGPAWADEVMAIYDHLGIAVEKSDVLYVGVGNGRDLPLVCPDFKTLTGVDLSSAMLDRARTVQSELVAVRGSAEALPDIKDTSIDLYLSLRTYQSSLFDIPSALRQAFRVLRRGSGLVLSIPGGFLDRSNDELRYVPGLLVPGSSTIVDRALPRQYATEILTQLDRMMFEHVGFHQREGDLYVYARKG